MYAYTHTHIPEPKSSGKQWKASSLGIQHYGYAIKPPWAHFVSLLWSCYMSPHRSLWRSEAIVVHSPPAWPPLQPLWPPSHPWTLLTFPTSQILPRVWQDWGPEHNPWVIYGWPCCEATCLSMLFKWIVHRRPVGINSDVTTQQPESQTLFSLNVLHKACVPSPN